MVAVLALCLGIAAPAWSLEDPAGETYTAHLIPFYKIDSNWLAFLVVTDTSFRDMSTDGDLVNLTFFNSACGLSSGAVIKIGRADAQLFALNDPTAADGQFQGIPAEGVILLDGNGNRFLTYILLINLNTGSMVRLDSIPCRGDAGGPCTRQALTKGEWLRYDTFNTVAATFGDSGAFETSLYFFTAQGELRTKLLEFGTPLHNEWASRINMEAFCDGGLLGSRSLDLVCTQRVRLNSLSVFPLLNTFPSELCEGKPGHIETWASDTGDDVVSKDFSGFHETVIRVGPSLVGAGYFHHSE
jgi:hypothetical protein